MGQILNTLYASFKILSRQCCKHVSRFWIQQKSDIKLTFCSAKLSGDFLIMACHSGVKEASKARHVVTKLSYLGH